MDNINKLNYISTEQMFEGIIVEVNDASVTIDLKGRLGELKVPLRMVISKWDLEVGQEVGFLMTYPEVLEEEANEDYVRMVKHQQAKERMRRKRQEAERGDYS